MTEQEQWYIIPCPSTVRLINISKERGTHGACYMLWETEGRKPAWVGQSIPALVRSINEKAITHPSKRLHASSLYRLLRRESRKTVHKHYSCLKFSRIQIDELNDFISQFPSVVFVSKSPELILNTGEEDPAKSSEKLLSYTLVELKKSQLK